MLWEAELIDAQIRDVDVRSSQASTNVTESSFNSQSALLGRTRQISRAVAASVLRMMMTCRCQSERPVGFETPTPVDLSDEDELDEVQAPAKPNRRAPPQEESLADFLKNYAPPPEPMPQALPSQNRPKKKASAPS